MSDRDETFEFTCTISPDGTVVIQTKDGSNGYGWGPKTTVAEEIVETLDDVGMFLDTTE